MGEALQAVQKYYQAFDKHQDGWQALLSEDISFQGPLQQAQGKQSVVALTAQFLQFHQETRLLRRVEEGANVCSMYEFVLSTPSGGTLSCSITEWAKVSEGKIQEFNIYYDPRAFARAFGMQE
jgi:ketosteroid isomerase-like protein